MNNVIVSVIIPTYKRSEDLARAVNSCLNQTLSEIEVIVVDDNGKNTIHGKKTEEVMQQYARDNRVIYIQHDKNKNGSAARNTGIRASSGEFISFLDDDDNYLPQRLEKMVNRMTALDDSWGACYTGYVKHLENGKDLFSKENNEGNLFKQTLMRSLHIGSGANMFFRKSAIEKVGLFDESFSRNQDLEYMTRMLKEYKIACVDEVLMEVNKDIRTNQVTYEQCYEREMLFRQRFLPYKLLLDKKSQREIDIMYDIDWMRDCLSMRKYVQLIRTFFKARIPIKVMISYLAYVYDRWKRNSCYGFIVKI